MSYPIQLSLAVTASFVVGQHNNKNRKTIDKINKNKKKNKKNKENNLTKHIPYKTTNSR